MLDVRSMSAMKIGGRRRRKDHQAAVSSIDALQPPDNLTDEELMTKLATGNKAALTPLHERYAGLVFGLIAQSLDRSVAEEITQDVFLTVWWKAYTYDPGRGPVRPWLLQIAHARMLNEVRRRGRRPRCVADPDEQQLNAAADNGPSPDEEVWRHDRQAAVVAAVAALPAPQREAVCLAWFEELSQQQVAARLGLPLGTAKTRIRVGKQRLRSALLATGAA
jgi:RNA polymerase sigma-70 factor (ECF subfamily)